MHRSYLPKNWIDTFLIDENTPLPQEAFTRFFSILRIRPDEKVAVFDGYGREIIGFLRLSKSNKWAHFTNAKLTITKPGNTKVVLVQSALHETKLLETIKRGSEYGVDQFIVVAAERNETFIYHKLLNKRERFIRVAQDACRQSGRLFIPSIDFVDSLGLVFKNLMKDPYIAVFGEVNQDCLLSAVLQKEKLFDKNFYIAVGPEGGFSTKERQELISNGFLAVQWAPFTLRSELASLAAIAIFNSFMGRA
jgi:16S rRNA (uracil1498-N3)-methyltransferase